MLRDLPVNQQRFDGDHVGKDQYALLHEKVEAAKRHYELRLEAVSDLRIALSCASDNCAASHEAYIAARNALTAAEAACASGDSRDEGHNPRMRLRSDV